MTDIKGKEIIKGDKLLDEYANRYEVIEKDEELYAKALFNDGGCGEYVLYQERVDRNKFEIIN